jgi:hypothetical protein
VKELHRRIVAAVMIALAVAAQAAAQSEAPAPKPYRPVFGPPVGAVGEGSMLDLRVDFAEAYDDNLLGEGTTVAPSMLQESGFYTSLTPQVDFAARGRRLQVSLTGGSNVRYYADAHQFFATNEYAAAGLTSQIAHSTSVSFSQGISYSSAYLYGLLSVIGPQAIGGVVPGGGAYSVNDQRSLAYSTVASLSQKLGQHATLSLDGGYHATNLSGTVASLSDVRLYEAGSKFTYSVSRNVRMRLGYGYRSAQYTVVLTPTEHDIDVGLDYTHPLSPTRRATVGFTLGPRLLNVPTSTTSAGANLIGPAHAQYRMTGDGSFTYGINRTWNVQAAYRRGLSFIGGLAQPVFTDGVTASTTGFLDRRTALMFAAAYSHGQEEFGQTPSPFTTYSGNARVQVGLTRILAFYSEYILYYYNFDPDIRLTPGVPHNMKRNSVRAGLTLWAPVIRN